MSGPQGSNICTAFVEALGLKTLFSAFMGKACHYVCILKGIVSLTGTFSGTEEESCISPSLRRHVAYPWHHLILAHQPPF